MSVNTFSGQDTSPSLPLPGIHRHRLPSGFQNVPPQFTFHFLLPLCCHQKVLCCTFCYYNKSLMTAFETFALMHLKNLSNHVNQMSFCGQALNMACAPCKVPSPPMQNKILTSKENQQSHLHLADHAKSQVWFLQIGECSLPAAA